MTSNGLEEKRMLRRRSNMHFGARRGHLSAWRVIALLVLAGFPVAYSSSSAPGDNKISINTETTSDISKSFPKLKRSEDVLTNGRDKDPLAECPAEDGVGATDAGPEKRQAGQNSDRRGTKKSQKSNKIRSGEKPKKSKSIKSPKKKSTISAKASKPASSAPTSGKSYTPESATLRRVKEEYKDAVNMGIAYDWVNAKPIRRPKSGRSNKSVAMDAKALALRLGPLSTNLREWHFSFVGTDQYASGIYHGVILLPKEYPAKPPAVQMWTPNGRFRPGHNICLSASSFHPESWTPKWTILGLVQSLRAHMRTKPQEIGGIVCTADEIADFARASRNWKMIFPSGAKVVTVDHALMQSQKVLVPEAKDKNDEKSADQKLKASDKSDSSSEDAGLKNTNLIASSAETVSEAAATAAVETPREDSPVVKKARKKSKSSSKRRKSSGTKAAKAEVAPAPEPSLLQAFQSEFVRAFLVLFSSLIASPARVAVLSFVLFVLLLRR